MEITSDIQALLDRMPTVAPAPPPPSDGLLGRIGKSIINLPSNIGEGVIQSGINLLEMGNPEGPKTKIDAANFFDIKAPVTTGEKVVDIFVGKGGIADIVGQSMIPAGLVGKVGTAAGMASGPKLEAVKWAAGFAGPELQREEATSTDVAVAAASGAASGGMSFLGRRARIIPNLISSTLHGGYEAAVRGPTAGLIAFGADMIGGQVPGAMKPTAPLATLQPPTVAPPIAPLTGPIAATLPIAPAPNTPKINGVIPTPAQPIPAVVNGVIPTTPLAAVNGVIPMPSGTEGRVESTALRYKGQLVEAKGIQKHDTLVVRGINMFAGDPDFDDALIERGFMVWENGKKVFKTRAEAEPMGIASGQLPKDFKSGKLGVQSEDFLDALVAAQTIIKPKAVRVKKAKFATLQKLEAEQPAAVDPTDNVAVVPKSAPAAQSVAVEPKVPPSAEEQAYSGDLLKRYAGMSETELRAIKSDLDFEIANTLDPATKRAYDTARSAVDIALETRGKSASPLMELDGMPVEAPSHTAGDRVTHKDVFGQETQGTVVSLVGGRVRVKFDGDAETSLLAGSTLTKSDIPRGEIATLQKPSAESQEVKDFAAELAAGGEQTVGLGEVDREATRTGKKPTFMGQMSTERRQITSDERGGYNAKVKVGDQEIRLQVTNEGVVGFVGNLGLSKTGEGAFTTMNAIKGPLAELLHTKLRDNPNQVFRFDTSDSRRAALFRRYLEKAGVKVDERNNFKLNPEDIVQMSVGPSVKVRGDPHIDVATKNIIDKVIVAFKAATNKELKFSFVSDAEISGAGRGLGTVLARTTVGNAVDINYSWMADTFANWHKKTELQKRGAVTKFARTLGHESSHIALNLAMAEDPKLVKKLLREFKLIDVETRVKIIGDYYSRLGIKIDGDVMAYHAGDPKMVGEAYGLHRWNIDAKEFMGMQEFFADMGSAYLFGRLNESLLPQEVRGMWGKIKDVFSKLIATLQKVTFEGTVDDVDQMMAYDNFQDMVKSISDKLPAMSPEQFRASSAKATDMMVGHEMSMRRADSSAASMDDRLAKGMLLERDLQGLRKYHGSEGWFKEMEKSLKDQNGQDKVMLANLQVKTSEAWPDGYGFASRMSWWGPSPIVGNKAFIQSELIRALGAATVGGLIGGVAGPRLTDNQMTVAEGVVAGAILGVAGPIALRRMLGSMPKPGTSPNIHIPPKEAFLKLFTKAGRLELGADAANGQGSAPAKLVRFMEHNLNLHLPPEAFNALVTAEGPAAYAVQIATDAFAKARNFVTDSTMDIAVADYLKSAISDADLRRALGTNLEAQDFGNFIITGRTAIGLLQQMFISGLPEGAFKGKIVKSFQDGDYLTRMYRIFNDPDYKPTQDQIEAVSLKLVTNNPDYDITTARAIVEDYIHQIETERAMYKGSVSDVGQKLDAAIFQKKNTDLDIVFRDMLGEYVTPKEQILGTIRHIYTNAIASKFYDNISMLTDANGLKMAYSREEVSTLKGSLQVAIRQAQSAGTDFATLQKQLSVLEGYVPLDPNVRFGKLKSQMVSRFVRDQLATFDSPWGILDGSIMRGMANFHNAIKIGRTALNPITVTRNIVSAPILMALGKGSPMEVPRVIAAMRNRSSADAREMLEQGIHGVDQVRGEFLRTTNSILMGDYDHSSIEGMFKTGLNKVLEFYRAPDMVVRGTVYFSAKKRFAKQFSLPETDQRVINAARDHTNRYTVNYQNIAPLIKTLRQVPFTNLFISYTAEVTRITKNLVMDVFQHPDMGQRVYAASMLAGLVSVPVIAELTSKAALSPKDQKEWERAQKLMPDYARTRFKVITRKEGDRFRYLDITPILQIDPMMQMFRAAAGGDFKAFLAVNPVFGWENTPLANVVVEQVTGRNMRNDRPIDQNVFTRAQAIMKEVVPPIMPGGYEFKRVTDALTRNEGGELGITNLRTGRRTTPGEIVSSYLTGMRLSTVDTGNLAKFAVSDAKRKIANEASYYRDVANTDLPLVAKQRAAKRYQDSVRSILLDLQQQMEVED